MTAATFAGTLLCAETVGLGCALVASAVPACATAGTAVIEACGDDRVLDLPEDFIDQLGGLGDTIDGFSGLEEAIHQMGGEINQWYTALSANDKKWVEGMANIIFMQKQLTSFLNATQDLSDDLDLAQVTNLYGEGIINLKSISDKFALLERGKFGIIKNDHRVEVFTDAALDPSNGLKSSIADVFAMMIGGHPLKTESIYEALGEEFCHSEEHRYVVMQLNSAVLLHATAMAMEGRAISTGLLRDIRQNFIRASQSYIRHCGCPEGYRETPPLIMNIFRLG